MQTIKPDEFNLKFIEYLHPTVWLDVLLQLELMFKSVHQTLFNV